MLIHITAPAWTMCAVTAALAVLVAGLALTAGRKARNQHLSGTASVIDGDTLDIHGVRVRLHGIDAPESGQTCRDAQGTMYRCGQRAALALSGRIGRHPVSCTAYDTDSYGRTVAVCHQGGTDLNAWMVAGGHALAYCRYSRDYVDEEEEARQAIRGLWAGRFVAPWEWRRGGQSDPSEGAGYSAPFACAIKGNISRSGARIYHLPGQKYYDLTVVSPGRGERWFCSETEARATGGTGGRLAEVAPMMTPAPQKAQDIQKQPYNRMVCDT